MREQVQLPFARRLRPLLLEAAELEPGPGQEPGPGPEPGRGRGGADAGARAWLRELARRTLAQFEGALRNTERAQARELEVHAGLARRIQACARILEERKQKLRDEKRAQYEFFVRRHPFVAPPEGTPAERLPAWREAWRAWSDAAADAFWQAQQQMLLRELQEAADAFAAELHRAYVRELRELRDGLAYVWRADGPRWAELMRAWEGAERATWGAAGRLIPDAWVPWIHQTYELLTAVHDALRARLRVDDWVAATSHRFFARAPRGPDADAAAPAP